MPADEQQPTTRTSWFKATRSPDAVELIRANPLAYVLAAVIAQRAQYREGFNPHSLTIGEAVVGDFSTIGFTRQQYRTAISHLEKWNFATFRPTNKGTIAKLTDTRLFEVVPMTNNQQSNQQATSRPPTSQPANNQQATNGLTTTIDQRTVERRAVEHRDVGQTDAPALSQPSLLSVPSAAVAAPASRETAEEIIRGLSANPAYTGIDVAREWHKMATWCQAHRAKPTRKRFINWLNRIDAPISGTISTPPSNARF